MSETEKKTRIRRTPEQMIADLEAKIRDVKARAQAKDMKTSPALKKAMTALRALDKGMDLAQAEGNSLLQHALADTRKSLGDSLTKIGLKLPKPRMPRGRKPRELSAEGE